MANLQLCNSSAFEAHVHSHDLPGSRQSRIFTRRRVCESLSTCTAPFDDTKQAGDQSWPPDSKALLVTKSGDFCHKERTRCMHILYPLKPRGHASRTVGSRQGMISRPGAGTPNLYLCHDPVIQRENFATGLTTVQILLLSELEIFSPLANTERRKPLGLVGHLRENDGTTHSLENRTYCSK